MPDTTETSKYYESKLVLNQEALYADLRIDVFKLVDKYKAAGVPRDTIYGILTRLFSL